MDITQISILHHVAIVLVALWLLSTFNCCYLIAYFVALVYLYQIHESYVMKLRKKLQFQERKQAYQSRALSDSETVRWLNHAVEKIWPICIEQIASQQILLPIVPWFLEKYKPWTAKKVEVQQLYLGRNPPIFTEMRVRQCQDDHLVLKLGINFVTADDMKAILAVKLRKRLGFGLLANLHLTGMHIEGKVLVGIKFIREWPFLSRLRICFVEPPYFQMTVKPMSTHGIDVTDIPGISGWIDNLLSTAFEQNLVEPNMLVVDVEKFVSPKPEGSWFSISGKGPVAYAKVEVVEASEIPPSDLNGLADPYVKGQLNGYKFKTKPQMKTLTPKWLEEFKIPIITWESPNVLAIDVCDKDPLYDDTLGDVCVNISDFRGGQRHDMWLPIQNCKSGRLHLAITVFEDSRKVVDDACKEKPVDMEEKRKFFSDETVNGISVPSELSEKFQPVPDDFEPIDVEGQKETGIWVHHPGIEVIPTWTSRKGKSRRVHLEVPGVTSDQNDSNCSSPEDNPEEKTNRMRSFKRGLHKISGVFSKSPRKDEQSGSFREAVQSPHDSMRRLNAKEIGGYLSDKVQ